MTFKTKVKRQSIGLFTGAIALTLAACSGGGNQAAAPGTDAAKPEEKGAAAGGATGATGEVLADGSSTVFPIAEAMAEEFMKANAGVKVTVGSSGTGGGFKKFCAGETDISNASRPIKQEEIDAAIAAIEEICRPILSDGL